ncbi:MAG: DUF3010 family protein [Eubacteriales bacterium]|jgi:hypothetical protein|nr:DUF3010 family protein [Eubacteriales bacterium]
MIVCGIDIKGNEAIFAVCKTDGHGDSEYIENDLTKIALNNEDQDLYKEFLYTVKEFVIGNEIEKVYLRKPMDKGRQLSGPNAFRIEALINLIEVPIVSLHPNTITSYIKKNENVIKNCDKTFKYQTNALASVLCGIGKEQ